MVTKLARILSGATVGVVVVSTIALALRYQWFRDVAIAADPEANLVAGPQATVIGLAWALCGLVVVWRTGNPVGWISTLVGLCFGLQWVGWAIWDLARVGTPIGGPVGLVGAFLESSWFPAMVLMTVVLPSVFPTGRLPTPRWTWVLVMAVAALTGMVVHVSIELITGSYLDAFDDDPVTILLFAPLLIGITGAVASMVTRFRRAGPTERQQIKWVVAALAATCMVILLLFFEVLVMIFGPNGGPLVGFGSFGLIPVAITLAILRYRLYDIDRIISRTVSYGLVVGLLAAIFFGIVTVSTSLLPTQSDLAVAGSTLAVAALFNPLRRRIQGMVERRFNRGKYDAQRVMDQFAGAVRDELDPARIVDGWLGAATKTMQPQIVGVWIREST